MALDDNAEVSLDRAWIGRIHGHHFNPAARATYLCGSLGKRLTATGRQHDCRTLTHKGACHCPTDRT